MQRRNNVVPLPIYPSFEQRLSGKRGLQRFAMTALPSIPRHAWHPFISEVRIAVQRMVSMPWRVRRQYRNQRDFLLNIWMRQLRETGLG